MTDEQIADMIADREAGTPGPWRVKVNSRDDQVTCDLTICGDIFQLADLNGPQYAHQHPNARRISRVPDMEATIIAQAAELATPPAAVVEAMERALRHADQVSRDLGWHRIYDETGAALADLEAWRAGK